MPPTRVIFIETRTEEKRDLLCKWAEYFCDTGRKVQIVVDSSMAAQHLDQLLWTFSQGSFVPHRIFSGTGPAAPFEPVVITIGHFRVETCDVVLADSAITLDSTEPYDVAVFFVLMDDPEKRQASRLAWQEGKEKGLVLQHVPYAARTNFPL